MLRHEFGWPKPDFSTLSTLGSSSARKLDGQPAPPLHIAHWLNSKPRDLSSFRGKVVLLEFVSIDEPWGEGASIEASLHFTMLVSAEPGSAFTAGYHRRDERFSALSGADGRFELSGLCKGAYLLLIRASGRAWLERTVFIGPDLDAASIELVLDQSDKISGLVRDREGKPVAGATVAPTARHHYEGDVFREITFPVPDAIKTDDEGRFRFSGLQEGRYAVTAKATGFKDRELEPIPAGDENVVVTLERSQ
jgi:hypothetical protein